MATHEENVDAAWDDGPTTADAGSSERASDSTEPVPPARTDAKAPIPPPATPPVPGMGPIPGMGKGGGPARVRPAGSRKTVLGMGSLKPAPPEAAPTTSPEAPPEAANPQPKPAALPVAEVKPVVHTEAVPQTPAVPVARATPRPKPVAPPKAAPGPAAAIPEPSDEATIVEDPPAEATSDPTDLDQPTEIDGGDEIEADRAYFAPRAVPKAALPTDSESAKVVINIPTPMGGGEEITQALDRDALVRQIARDEQIALARRREPTVRIPRKDVQKVRAEIAAQERAAEAGVPYVPAAPFDEISVDEPQENGGPARRDDIEPTVGAPRSSSSRFTVVALMLVALAVAGGATWYATQKTPSSAVSQNDGARNDSGATDGKPKGDPVPAATTQATQAQTAGAPDTVAPPLELSAEAAHSADPNVVTLDASAAQGKPGASAKPPTPPASTSSSKPPGGTASKPAGPPYGAPHPPAGTPSAKPFKPVIPTEI